MRVDPTTDFEILYQGLR